MRPFSWPLSNTWDCWRARVSWGPRTYGCRRSGKRSLALLQPYSTSPPVLHLDFHLLARQVGSRANRQLFDPRLASFDPLWLLCRGLSRVGAMRPLASAPVEFCFYCLCSRPRTRLLTELLYSTSCPVATDSYLTDHGATLANFFCRRRRMMPAS